LIVATGEATNFFVIDVMADELGLTE